MIDKDERSKEVEKTEFPVDVRPLKRSFILLLLVFIGLCYTVYSQDSAASFGLGNILLALAFGFAAYVQRDDSYRVGATLIGGTIICIFVYIFAGGSDESPAKKVPAEHKTLPLSAPEGLGE